MRPLVQEGSKLGIFESFELEVPVEDSTQNMKFATMARY